MPLPLYETVRKENEEASCTVQRAALFVGKGNFISNSNNYWFLINRMCRVVDKVIK